MTPRLDHSRSARVPAGGSARGARRSGVQREDPP
jgi:hypothetical protein